MPFSTTQLPDYIGLFRARKFPMVVEMPVVTHLERGYCQGGRDRQEDWEGIVSTPDRLTARVWTGTLSVKPDMSVYCSSCVTSTQLHVCHRDMEYTYAGQKRRLNTLHTRSINRIGISWQDRVSNAASSLAVAFPDNSDCDGWVMSAVYGGWSVASQMTPYTMSWRYREEDH